MIIPNKKSDLRIEYIDIYVPNDHEETITQKDIFLDKLKNIFKKLSKKEPLYNEIRESVLIQIAVEEIENDQSILYKCQV